MTSQTAPLYLPLVQALIEKPVLPLSKWREFPRLKFKRSAPISEVLGRFWSSVKVGSQEECWTWSRNVQQGYPQFCAFGVAFRGHRLAIYFDGREIPEGHEACHTCDNPMCVNPSHLYAGTRAQNMRDAVERNRIKTHRILGELNKASKLSSDAVIAVRILKKHSNFTNKELGAIFGVCESTIEHINAWKQWAHLKDTISLREVL